MITVVFRTGLNEKLGEEYLETSVRFPFPTTWTYCVIMETSPAREDHELRYLWNDSCLDASRYSVITCKLCY